MINPILKEDFDFILADKLIDWERFAGKTVLVTGASGFLPSYMIQTLLHFNSRKVQEPTRIIGLVRDLSKAKEKYADYLNDDNLNLLVQDVSTPFTIEDEVDFIIHAASQASPKFFFSDPVGTINANTLGTTHLLELAKEKKVKSFLYFSTGEVNGDALDKLQVVNEDDYGAVDPLIIRNSYAESKRMGENMCASWFAQYGVPAKIIRPSHTYGPGFSFDDGRAFTSFVASVFNNKDIVLNSDGSAKRSFCYIADATRAYFLVLLNGENANAYNVGNEYEISIKELASLIIEVSGKNNLKIVYPSNNNVQKSPSNTASHGLLGINKIKKLGWSPVFKEKEGFKRTLESLVRVGVQDE